MLPENGWSKMPEQSNWLPIYLSSGQKTHLLFNSVQILGGASCWDKSRAGTLRGGRAALSGQIR